MSITPIEMYTMVPKSQEVSHLRHGEMTKNAGQQVEAASQFERNLNDNSQKTLRLKETDDPEYRYDQHKEGGSHGGNMEQHQKRGKNKPENGPRGYMGSSGIDIRI